MARDQAACAGDAVGLQSADRAIQGVGLGLTIVQSIIALHGGTIEVSSAPGEGTTVTVRLPRTAAVPVGDDAPAA